MNVKSIDIARALGISKSTVSLALNGKPGVSEQTRQEVLACKKQLEEHGVVPPGMFSRQPEQRKRQQIKIVKITNGMKNIVSPAKYNVTAKAAAAKSCKNIFWLAFKPWFCFLTTFK